jgi:nitrite reductase (NO-forming)
MGRLASRADWHLRANLVVIAYLAAALLATFISNETAVPSWLALHLLLLGATSNAIVAWTNHFVSALLWARGHDYRRQFTVLILLNIGIVGVLVAVTMHIGWLIIASATLVGAIIVFHLLGIVLQVKQSFNKRFVPVVRYYQWAALFLIVGITLGVLDTFKGDGDRWQSRIALAHLHANLLGWVGLTIIGTLVTLWPTVLGTQIHTSAVSQARKGLTVLLPGVIGAILSALFEQRIILAISLIIYLLGVVIALTPSIFVLQTKMPHGASSWMLLSGIFGLLLLLLGDFIIVLSNQSSEKTLAAIEAHILLIFTLWLFPTLLGSLMFLLPVVLGRGPTSTRAFGQNMNLGWHWRIWILPIASVLLLLPSKFHPFGEGLTVVALGIFLSLTVKAVWVGRKNFD